MQFMKKYFVATSHARTCISAASRVKTHIGTTSGLPFVTRDIFWLCATYGDTLIPT